MPTASGASLYPSYLVMFLMMGRSVMDLWSWLVVSFLILHLRLPEQGILTTLTLGSSRPQVTMADRTSFYNRGRCQLSGIMGSAVVSCSAPHVT